MAQCPCPKCGCGSSWLQPSAIKIDSERIKQLLGSNEPPTERDRVHLIEARADYRNVLSLARSQMPKLEAAIAALRREETSMHRISRNLTTILSPARTLPADLWHEIFRACISDVSINLENQSTACWPSSTSFSRPPWTFTRVSSRWRKLAIDCPSLWSHISLVFQPSRTALKIKKLGHLIRCHIQRSKLSPLSISLDLSDGADITKYNSILQMLLSHSVRWRRLRFEASDLDQCKFLEDVEDFPSLESLYMHSDDETDYRAVLSKMMPRLTRISLDPTSVAAASQLPYLQIASYISPDSYTATEFVKALRLLPELVEMHLDCHFVEDAGLKEIVTLPKLATLSIRGQLGRHSDDPITQILAHLETPNLSTLTMQGNVNFDAVLGFVRRSAAPLERFGYKGGFMDCTNCIRFLRNDNIRVEVLALSNLGFPTGNKILESLADLQLTSRLKSLVIDGEFASKSSVALNSLRAKRPTLKILVM